MELLTGVPLQRAIKVVLRQRPLDCALAFGGHLDRFADCAANAWDPARLAPGKGASNPASLSSATSTAP
jgi:hypothetical protein